MSMRLLQYLNGDTRGQLRKYLDTCAGAPRIAWYPSAGTDFRALLYLNPRFAAQEPAAVPDPEPPDIFLYTDYFPWSNSKFLDGADVHVDPRTTVRATLIEQLPRLDLPCDPQIVDFPAGSQATSLVLYLELLVRSNKFGEYPARLIYAFVENEAFCARCILPQQGQLSHIIHIRYGGGLGGGGKAAGGWLLNVLGRCGCECFITDGDHRMFSGDSAALRLYPELKAKKKPTLKPWRVIESKRWSEHGDVSWNTVQA